MFISALWDIALTLHIFGIVFWVGGSLFAVAVTRASVRALDPVQRHNVILAALAIFFRLLWPVMIVTLVTGWILAMGLGGFRNLPWQIDAMQGIAILMAIIFVTCYFGPFRTARRAIRSKPETLRSIHLRLSMMSMLGLLAIIFGVLNSGF